MPTKKVKSYTCPHCGKTSEKIGVTSICRQHLYIESDDWTDLEVGETLHGFCLECSAEVPADVMKEILQGGELAPDHQSLLRDLPLRSPSCKGVTKMDILVGIHIGSDFNDGGINCAKISLDDKAIKHIFKLARRAKPGQIIQETDYTPELGITELDLENDERYRDLANLSKKEDLANLSEEVSVFAVPTDAPRVDCVQLCVDENDFWFEGMFKHTDVHWETRMIPLSFLPQHLRPVARQAQSGKHLPDLNMTADQMNAIHEKIAQGIAQGLNAREIEATFQKHVTKAQFIRCMIELIERSH